MINLTSQINIPDYCPIRTNLHFIQERRLEEYICEGKNTHPALLSSSENFDAEFRAGFEYAWAGAECSALVRVSEKFAGRGGILAPGRNADSSAALRNDKMCGLI
jgi:hypothetical protein